MLVTLDQNTVAALSMGFSWSTYMTTILTAAALVWFWTQLKVLFFNFKKASVIWVLYT